MRQAAQPLVGFLSVGLTNLGLSPNARLGFHRHLIVQLEVDKRIAPVNTKKLLFTAGLSPKISASQIFSPMSHGDRSVAEFSRECIYEPIDPKARSNEDRSTAAVSPYIFSPIKTSLTFG
jgi:hypothetical protein